MISLNPIQMLDLACRIVLLGQLSVFAILFLKKGNRSQSRLWLWLMACLGGYLLLTSPMPDSVWGAWRGLWLLLTELAPYAMWSVALFSLRGSFVVAAWPRALPILLLGVSLWFAYFFGFQQGRGHFHQVNHALSIILLAHIIVVALSGLKDDLVDRRRRLRIGLVVYFGLFASFMATLELADPVGRNTAAFGLFKILAIWPPLTYLGYFWLVSTPTPNDVAASADSGAEPSDERPTLPMHYRAAHARLLLLMEEGFYRQPELTVKALAEAVLLPEHQLRQLINQHLGYDNFATFLNSYRVPAACKAMKDVENSRKPILTLALDLGYGSIGPFNRAFKMQMGLTPSEFRRQFQK